MKMCERLRDSARTARGWDYWRTLCEPYTAVETIDKLADRLDEAANEIERLTKGEVTMKCKQISPYITEQYPQIPKEKDYDDYL
jgi:hypothetical protein